MGRIYKAHGYGLAIAGALLPMLMAGGYAQAADPSKGKGVESPGVSNVSNGGSSSSESSASTATSRTTGGTDDTVGGLIDAGPGKSGKWLEVGGTFETHALLWQDNTSNAKSKLFDFAYFYAGLNITRNDRIRIRGGFYEYLLADQGESGVRATDLSLSYSHLFRLPDSFAIRATVGATAPISFYSQKASLITSPTASVSITKDWHGFSADISAFGGAYITKYSTYEGGGPNPEGILGLSAEVDYSLWFFKSISLGVDIYTAYLWYYSVGSAPPAQYYGYGTDGTTSPGASADPTFKSQPVQQLYGGEVFIRYSAPAWHKIHADLTVALADGDPTLGYNSRIIDGTSHFFADYYQTFEVYGALSLRY